MKAKLGLPQNFSLASPFSPMIPNKGTLCSQIPPGTGRDIYFNLLLFLYGQLVDSTCLQEVLSKYQMSSRPHDILSPALNASNVRLPAFLPLEVDHVT